MITCTAASFDLRRYRRFPGALHQTRPVSSAGQQDLPVPSPAHVSDELATLLGRIAGYRYAADRVDDLYVSESVDVLASTREDEIEAIRWMRKYADKEISFTDCVSFAMMHRLGIRTAFTFDRHFRDAGFQIIDVSS